MAIYQTIWSLLPPLVAISLALITKEVYSSLFIGIVVGGLLFSGFSFEGTLVHVFNDGIVASLADAYNVGILVFLVILGILVVLMNKSGGSEAFGRWTKAHVKTKLGAECATILLGILIFIDDYFNCLTVGSVMSPVAEEARISKAKLAYLVDCTAAPICIIAPVSSWAAAVSGFAGDGGFSLFIKAIPYNFYAILTIIMMFTLAIGKFEFGAMKKYESNLSDKLEKQTEHVASKTVNEKGIVLDLVAPIVVLIISCVIGMLYSGNFFNGTDFVTAFSESDASVGLMLGSAVTLVITMIYYGFRKVLSFKDMMKAIPEGFKSMASAILILTLAWSLKAMTDSLGAKEYVAGIVQGSASAYQIALPAIIFVIGCILSFATGTSWGTFGILIPITLAVFPLDNPLGVVCVSACMAGAVCGDHCSPISDTTIMASAGTACDHVTHVNTQLPYALVVASVSFVSYLIAGFIPNWFIVLPISIIMMIAVLLVIKKTQAAKAS